MESCRSLLRFLLQSLCDSEILFHYVTPNCILYRLKRRDPSDVDLTFFSWMIVHLRPQELVY